MLRYVRSACKATQQNNPDQNKDVMADRDELQLEIINYVELKNESHGAVCDICYFLHPIISVLPFVLPFPYDYR